MKAKLFSLFLIFLSASSGWAESSEDLKDQLRIGFIGSLTGVAASYGSAVLDGARLAVEELDDQGVKIPLYFEDDQSLSKQTVTAYTKLRTIDRVTALIGGTWFANSIAKQTERHSLPFLSCETLYDKDFVRAKTYFSLGGDLREWVRAYEPLIRHKKFGSAITVKFTSGFADTIAEEMQSLFSKPDRKYLGHIEYSDFQMNEAGTIATRLKKLKPEVLYIDAQPSSLSSLLRRMSELKISSTVLTNSILNDALKQGLVDPQSLGFPIYFTQRSSFAPDFVKRFKDRYQREPVLNSDLGYYAVHLLHRAFQREGDPTKMISSGSISFGGHTFSFNDDNVWAGVAQEVWSIKDGDVAPVRGG